MNPAVEFDNKHKCEQLPFLCLHGLSPDGCKRSSQT